MKREREVGAMELCYGGGNTKRRTDRGEEVDLSQSFECIFFDGIQIREPL